jgi:hypothetical protein
MPDHSKRATRPRETAASLALLHRWDVEKWVWRVKGHVTPELNATTGRGSNRSDTVTAPSHAT